MRGLSRAPPSWPRRTASRSRQSSGAFRLPVHADHQGDAGFLRGIHDSVRVVGRQRGAFAAAVALCAAVGTSRDSVDLPKRAVPSRQMANPSFVEMMAHANFAATIVQRAERGRAASVAGGKRVA